MSWGFRRQGDAGGAVLAADTAARLADDFVESYVSWREASEAVRTAYAPWPTTGSRPGRRGVPCGPRPRGARRSHFPRACDVVWSPWK
jgi:hypothetical protein